MLVLPFEMSHSSWARGASLGRPPPAARALGVTCAVPRGSPRWGWLVLASPRVAETLPSTLLLVRGNR